MLSLAKASAPRPTPIPKPANPAALSLTTAAKSANGSRVPAAAVVIPMMSLLKLTPVLLRSLQVPMPSSTAFLIAFKPSAAYSPPLFNFKPKGFNDSAALTAASSMSFNPLLDCCSVCPAP